jgi:hypothetical protein
MAKGPPSALRLWELGNSYSEIARAQSRSRGVVHREIQKELDSHLPGYVELERQIHEENKQALRFRETRRVDLRQEGHPDETRRESRSMVRTERTLAHKAIYDDKAAEDLQAVRRVFGSP